MAPSIDLDSPNPAIVTSKRSSHPLAPLDANEIASAASLVQQQWPPGTDIHFKVVTLQEPPKAQMIPLIEAENSGKTFRAPNRIVYLTYYIRNTDKFHEALVDLSEQKVERNARLGPNIHSSLDGGEIISMEQDVLKNEKVKQELAKLKLPAGAVVVVDPWIYGSDGVDDDERMAQCFMYMRDPENSKLADSNHYALPLPLSPVFRFTTRELVRIDYLPTGADHAVHPPKPYKKQPPNEYVPESMKLRQDLKPLHVVQPEGASFKVTEEGTSNVVDWQKWSFRTGFNAREGLVLHNIRYVSHAGLQAPVPPLPQSKETDDRLQDNRSLFYRLSLSDMNIPYADSRSPFHRKSAFDLGDAGAGTMSNDLKLGCDCLGSVYYLSATLPDDKAEPTEMNNCVCIHEQDNGIGWKHTNYRTGRAIVARNRELVLQQIITVANYEYILAFIFNQAGEVHYEVRATGILSTQPIDEGVEVPFGTVVHPGVLATNHQHIFSLRVDPMIEGHDNRLVYSEAHALPLDPKTNPHGNGYVGKETVITHSGGYDNDFDANRVFKIQNTSVRNPINNQPVGYKIHAPPFQKNLSHPDSFNFKRAEFADKALYAVKYRDDELYAGGKYTNQSRGGSGVRSWAARSEDIVDTDLVVFVQFGINHIPRVEDFPVMPCEVLKVSLKPVNFFDRNPSIDVPPSNQAFNQSHLLSEQHRQPSQAATVTNGSNGETCCEIKTTGTAASHGANGYH